MHGVFQTGARASGFDIGSLLFSLCSMILLPDEKFVQLRDVIKLCLSLSHGQATVESGFSVKDIIIENQHDHTLVAQRQVHDAVAVKVSYKGVAVLHDYNYLHCILHDLLSY